VSALKVVSLADVVALVICGRFSSGRFWKWDTNFL
jgi:hypothetical protein